MRMNPKKVKKKFHIGDSIGWISKNQTSVEIKKGQIVAIVPPEKDFREIEEELSQKSVFLAYWSGGTWRKEESYAVMVTIHGHLPRLYWPRVDSLEKVTELSPSEKI